jgi:hypothetical protein
MYTNPHGSARYLPEPVHFPALQWSETRLLQLVMQRKSIIALMNGLTANDISILAEAFISFVRNNMHSGCGGADAIGHAAQ